MLKYYDELSPYHYGMDCSFSEVKNIGWLHKDYPFKTGEIDSIFLKKLKRLILKSDEDGGRFDVLVDRLRGSCACPVCGQSDLRISDENKSFLLGSAEVWIPDIKSDGNYFATFGLIIHYIEEHTYQPPQEFIDSVLLLDENAGFNAQSAQAKLSEQYILSKSRPG
jgi:hypothetical protein